MDQMDDPDKRLETVLGGLQVVAESQLQFTIGLFRLLAQQLVESRKDTLLDAREAAARLRVSETWVRRRSARLPFRRRVGRLVRYSSNELDRWIRAQKR